MSAIACRYCRTGSALRYLQTHEQAEAERAARKKRRKAGELVHGPEPEADPHDEGCTTARELALHDQGPELHLYCQVCGQRRTGDRMRWALTPTDDLWCPSCDLLAPHHPAPRADVLAERCLCGACRTRRAFDEAAVPTPVTWRGPLAPLSSQ